MKKKITEKERMMKLVSSFEEKNEILKEGDGSNSENEIVKASSRLKEIARIDEWIANPKLNQSATYMGGHGVTVNSFIPNTEEQNVKMYNPNFTYLQAKEALEVSLKRAIESGSPVNNLGFYEEINWHLSNMGFNPRMPIDIKEALKKLMINDK